MFASIIPRPGDFVKLLRPEPARKPLVLSTRADFADHDAWRAEKATLEGLEREAARKLRAYWAAKAPSGTRHAPLEWRRTTVMIAVRCAPRTHGHVAVRHWHLTAPVQRREPRETPPPDRHTLFDAEGHATDNLHVERRLVQQEGLDGLVAYSLTGEKQAYRALESLRATGDFYAPPWQREREYNRQFWDDPCHEAGRDQPAYAGPTDPAYNRQALRDEWHALRDEVAALERRLPRCEGGQVHACRRALHAGRNRLCDIARRLYGIEVREAAYDDPASDLSLILDRKAALVAACSREDLPIAEAMAGVAELDRALACLADSPDLARACAGVIRARQLRDPEKLRAAVVAWQAARLAREQEAA